MGGMLRGLRQSCIEQNLGAELVQIQIILGVSIFVEAIMALPFLPPYEQLVIVLINLLEDFFLVFFKADILA